MLGCKSVTRMRRETRMKGSRCVDLNRKETYCMKSCSAMVAAMYSRLPPPSPSGTCSTQAVDGLNLLHPTFTTLTRFLGASIAAVRSGEDRKVLRVPDNLRSVPYSFKV